MDVKDTPRLVDINVPSEDRIKDKDEIDIMVTEKPGDIENDFEKDEIKLQSDFVEVRAAAEIGDDENMPAETFRAYAIAIILTVLGATTSNITDLREEPLIIDSAIVQLISLPIGRLWAKYMPVKTIGFGRWSFQLNPGPFTIKEHTLIVIMANVGTGWPPYAVGLIIMSMVKYSTHPSDSIC
jgi:OPT oligopeptide transporter protein